MLTKLAPTAARADHFYRSCGQHQEQRSLPGLGAAFLLRRSKTHFSPCIFPFTLSAHGSTLRWQEQRRCPCLPFFLKRFSMSRLKFWGGNQVTETRGKTVSEKRHDKNCGKVHFSCWCKDLLCMTSWLDSNLAARRRCMTRYVRMHKYNSNNIRPYIDIY